MTTVTVRHPGGEYPVHIGCGLLAGIGPLLCGAGVVPCGRVAIVSNSVVAPLYAGGIEDSLAAEGCRPVVVTTPDGEAHKRLPTVARVYDELIAARLDRHDTLLALGGGVTGDLAGFAAATFLRGIRLVQVPTSLVAMIDASVGGKTAVDLPQGKNLVGAFKQPAAVVVDPAALATLDAAELRAGVGEAIKHALVGDPGLFGWLEDHAGDCGSWWTGEAGAQAVARALAVKIDVVETDPFEEGRRAVLNLGHTVGHALEQASGYRLRHGEAVAVGLVAESHLAAALGLAETSLPARVGRLVARWDLPLKCPDVDPEVAVRAIGVDKKRRGRNLRWPLPAAVGDVRIVEDVPESVVRQAIRRVTVE